MFFMSIRYATAVGVLAGVHSVAVAQEQVETGQTVSVRSERLIEDRENQQVIYEGDVEARFDDRILRADRVIYDLKNEIVRAQGNVEIVDADGGVRFADEIQVDEQFENGFALNFSTRMKEGGIATASSAVREEGRLNALEQMSYTACSICAESEGTPTWAIRAKRAVQNQETQMLSYQHAVVEIKGVPVFYVPYLAHPDPSAGRRSGFLPPTPGASSTLGLKYKQPYYWAISPYQELTIAPTVYQRVNPVIEVNHRKRFWSGFVDTDFSFTYDKDFDSDGEPLPLAEDTWRSHLFGKGVFQISPDWKWGYGLELQSDSLYDLKYDISDVNEVRGLYSSPARQLLSQFYTQGQTENFYAELGLLRFQSLRTRAIPAEVPLVLPTLFAEKYFDLGDLGQLSLAGSSAVIDRDIGVSSARVTADVNWRDRNILGPGLVLEPFAELRADAYDIKDTTDQVEEKTRSRVLGLAGAQLSWPLQNRVGAFDVIIEPTVMAAWGTEGANNDGIPNEDALAFESDATTLFKPNGASNYDLWEGGTRYSAGLSATANWGRNNSITGIFGRRWREAADPRFEISSNLNGTDSDYVAASGLTLGRTFSVDTRLRLDDEGFDLKRVDARATVDYWRVSASTQYFRLADDLVSAAIRSDTLRTGEGAVFQGRFDMTDNWSVIAGFDRNLEESFNVRQSYGIAYEDDCSYFELTYERNQLNDASLEPSESINFRFSLKSLGEAGSSNFD